MAERRVAECPHCGSPVRWVITRKGKKMPIDDEPSSAGKFAIEGDVDSPRASFIRNDEDYTGDRFCCHFDTCSNPQPRRKKSKG